MRYSVEMQLTRRARVDRTDRLFLVVEVAERLRVNPESIRRWIRQKKMRGVLLGGTRSGYRIAESEVERFIREGGRTPAPASDVS